MRNPSTADGVGADPAPSPPEPHQGQTRPNVKGETAPRLPHEHDESADSGEGPPGELMRRAQQDVEAGRAATDRGEASDDVYRRTLRDRPPGNERDPGSADGASSRSRRGG